MRRKMARFGAMRRRAHGARAAAGTEIADAVPRAGLRARHAMRTSARNRCMPAPMHAQFAPRTVHGSRELHRRAIRETMRRAPECPRDFVRERLRGAFEGDERGFFRGFFSRRAASRGSNAAMHARARPEIAHVHETLANAGRNRCAHAAPCRRRGAMQALARMPRARTGVLHRRANAKNFLRAQGTLRKHSATLFTRLRAARTNASTDTTAMQTSGERSERMQEPLETTRIARTAWHVPPASSQTTDASHRAKQRCRSESPGAVRKAERRRSRDPPRRSARALRGRRPLGTPAREIARKSGVFSGFAVSSAGRGRAGLLRWDVAKRVRASRARSSRLASPSKHSSAMLCRASFFLHSMSNFR